jgi:hypothetical protein
MLLGIKASPYLGEPDTTVMKAIQSKKFPDLTYNDLLKG